jgi:hypothetical protein
MLPSITKKKPKELGSPESPGPPSFPPIDPLTAEIRAKRKELRTVEQLLSTKKSELEACS